MVLPFLNGEICGAGHNHYATQTVTNDFDCITLVLETPSNCGSGYYNYLYTTAEDSSDKFYHTKLILDCENVCTTRCMEYI